MGFKEAATLIVCVGAYPLWQVARFIKANLPGEGDKMDPRGSQEIKAYREETSRLVAEHARQTRASAARIMRSGLDGPI